MTRREKIIDAIEFGLFAIACIGGGLLIIAPFAVSRF
jgi:hypothetical protein